MADIAALTSLIEPEANALGFDLVRVAMFGGRSDPTLQVMAERPDTRQLDLGDCEALSRRISDALDHADPIEEGYRLEVSSPGIDRPLTRLKDFADWTGHMARLKLSVPLADGPGAGRKQFDATLGGFDGGDLLLEAPNVGAFRVPFATVATAKLVLTDKLIKATAPLSPTGADEIIEMAPAGANENPQEG